MVYGTIDENHNSDYRDEITFGAIPREVERKSHLDISTHNFGREFHRHVKILAYDSRRSTVIGGISRMQKEAA